MMTSVQWTKWLAFHDASIRQFDEKLIGVYEIANAVETVYIGKGFLRNRLMAHLLSGDEPTPDGDRFHVMILPDEDLAISIEEKLLKSYRIDHGRLPKYNERIG